jgi:hypothetical protein
VVTATSSDAEKKLVRQRLAMQRAIGEANSLRVEFGHDDGEYGGHIVVDVSDPQPPPTPKIPIPAKSPSCHDRRGLDELTRITIQQKGSGTPIQWGVDLLQRVFGPLWVMDSYVDARNGKRYAARTRAYLYSGTGGITHGSRQDVKSGSQYVLYVQGLFVPAAVTGIVACTAM